MNNIIKIYEDGNCFFRCLAINSLSDLQTCIRYKNGRCKSRILFSKENNLSNSLRHLISNFIEDNKTTYSNNMIDNCNLYLEDENIDEHIERMRNDTEFAENLELVGASDFLKINIKVWVINGSELNLVDTKGHFSKTINLLLLDNEHYDLLILNYIDNISNRIKNFSI